MSAPGLHNLAVSQTAKIARAEPHQRRRTVRTSPMDRCFPLRGAGASGAAHGAAEAEKKKKKGRADHLKRIQQEAKEDDSEERKEERREAIAERKRKRGDADKHWAMEILKVSGQKKAKLTALEQMVASMRREIEEEVKLELE